MTIVPNNIDIALVAISWMFTFVFALIASHGIRNVSHKSATLFSLFLVLFACVCAFAVVTQVPPWVLPAVLYWRFFDGTYLRFCLLLFWLLCSLVSLLFISLIVRCCCASSSPVSAHVSTVHRKFFHLTASLVTVTGLFYDPPLLAVCVHLLLQIFIILELLRSLRVEPFCYLDNWLLSFIDSRQESQEQITTPILLLIGLNLPVLFDFRILTQKHSIGTTPLWTIKQWHFAGIISVGVGDSAAAIIGSKFGRIQWHSLFGGSAPSRPSVATEEGNAPLIQSNNSPRKISRNTKTAEGSLAMFVAQFVVAEWLMVFNTGRFSVHSWHNDSMCCSVSGIVPSFVAALVATLVEAQLSRYDNIIVPLCSMITFWMFG